MFELHDKRIAHINETCFQLVSAITRTKREPVKPVEPVVELGSVAEAVLLDLGEVTVVSINKASYSQKKLDVTVADGEDVLHLNEHDYAALVKLVSTIIKEPSVARIMSEDFISNAIESWVFNTYRLGMAESSFCDYLRTQADAQVFQYDVLVPVDYIHIEERFSIGNAEFMFFTKEELDAYDKAYLDAHPGGESPYLSGTLSWLGKVFCVCKVRGESIRARHLAFEVQALATDVLMITSETLAFPDFELSFDLNTRSNKVPMSTTFLLKNGDPLSSTAQLKMEPPRIYVNKAYLEVMRKRNLDTFDAFLRNEKQQGTELGKLLIHAITELARALTNPDLHWRTASLFSIVESLILPNDQAPILESIRKYLPRIVSKDLNTRKNIIVMTGKMYDVRSSIVHHARKLEFNLEDLALLQRCTNWLCNNLIVRLDTHHTKASVLSEIDTALLEAG